ncbi:hypothetical protein IMG5_001020 [Ichthyophthirius multifiliis]|uniref:Cation efflux protein transmembrane domain-containing protein n=1 Tax=Ichthyophthirius multifiliis TaxID=5932 RepID=G0QIY8_ICHMU|nr:hypothetical protein IMG5_001020 [Ichthyophthirius multifiliis]EGR34873.1 hypothetical protein IMG5_001020 [Ichthyophthirius multifiliis]|eukprot:XP_004040177.1 hypothetical protein IMG5_001020 [Ichthyophthirius multifiliis]
MHYQNKMIMDFQLLQEENSKQQTLLKQQISPEIQKNSLQTYNSSEDDENVQDENWDHIYNVPNMGNITKKVLIKLITASIIAFLFLIAEVTGGILAASLAILSDAAHMFSDISGFFISIFSVWIGTKPASTQLSYGYHRSEVIGAMASIFIIWGLTILLLYEATHRIIKQEKVEEPLYMLITAGFGLFCNIIMAKVLHSAPGHSHHGCSHGHSHDHDHDHEHEKDHEHKKNHEHNHNHDHNHNHKHKHKHNHDHSHNSDHNHDHEHNHSHNHNHEHNQGHNNNHGHEHNNEKQKNQIINNKKSGSNCSEFSAKQYGANKQDIAVSLQPIDQNQNQQIQQKNKRKNLSQISAKDNYNLRAAMIHVIGDIIQSIGVLIAALLIYFLDEKTKYIHLADPICTYLFSVLVLFTTFPVAKECIKVLMEGTPTDINIKQFEAELNAIKDIEEIHDLHIWSLSKGKPSLSCHIFCKDNPKEVLKKATRLCRYYGIYHTTIQVEDYQDKGSKNYIKCDHNIHH